jgi:Zn-dependent protease
MVNDIAQALTYFLAMLLALTFHEAAHAFVAHIRGDDTAVRQGRLSLNPAVHADLVGTIILPLAGFLMQLPLIGWAKPVPVDERNFKNPAMDSLYTALAGPGSNLIMALGAVLTYRLYTLYGVESIPQGSFFYPVVKLVIAFAFVNAVLAFFNLIPLPPLDGASILRVVLPRDSYEKYETVVAPYGFIILLVLAIGGGLKWISAMSQYYIGLCDVVVSLVLPNV